MTEMEAMPPIDYSQLATKRDLDALSAELRGEMAGLRGELRGEMAGLRGEFAALDAKMDSGFAQVEGEMAELRGETMSLLGAADLKMAMNVRLLLAGQIATVVLLGGWMAAVT